MGSDNTLKLWEVSSGRCLRTFKGHTARVVSVGLSADGRYALSGSEDETLKLWEVSSGRCLRTFERDGFREESNSLDLEGRFHLPISFVKSVALDADARYALSGSDDQLSLWEVGRGVGRRESYEVSGIRASEGAAANEAAFREGMGVAALALKQGDASKAAGALRRVRSLPGCQRRLPAFQAWQNLYQHLPKRAFVAGWEERTFEGHTANVSAVALSADGRHALSGSEDHTLKLWELSSGRCVRTLEGHPLAVVSVSLSADGRYALWESKDQTLKLWGGSRGSCLQTFVGHKKDVVSVSLSADGRYVLSGSDDHTLKLWELSSGRCLRTFEGLEGHTSSVLSVRLSADGRYALSGSEDGTLKLWEVSSGRYLREVEGHTDGVSPVSLSADGRYALLACYDTLKLWELSSGHCLWNFETHSHSVTAVSLSADGRYALSGSSDRTLNLWELPSGRCLRTFEGHTGSVTCVSLSPDARYALSGSADKTLKLWALDWELDDKEPADWNEGARRYLEVFLARQTPYAAVLPSDREPSEHELTLALTRRGRPAWTEEDFQRLLTSLGCAGYGWLRPAGVRRVLEELAATWTGPPSPPLESGG